MDWFLYDRELRNERVNLVWNLIFFQLVLIIFNES